MCIDTDLFGEVVISRDDVEFYLDHCTNYGGETTTKRKAEYIKNYNIANNVRRAKLDGSFYVAKLQHDIDVKNQLTANYWLYPTVYVEPQPAAPICPPHFHTCINPTCRHFMMTNKRAYSRRMYLKRKFARA